MTDRELLEYAARSAGVMLVGECESEDGFIGFALFNGKIWNPLTDDGDALRLAVRLNIEFYRANDEGLASYAGYWGKPERCDVTRMFCIEYDDDINSMGDPYAATRRAIVRAAAAIGKDL